MHRVPWAPWSKMPFLPVRLFKLHWTQLSSIMSAIKEWQTNTSTLGRWLCYQSLSMCFACKQTILLKIFTATTFLHSEKSPFCSCRKISRILYRLKLSVQSLSCCPRHRLLVQSDSMDPSIFSSKLRFQSLLIYSKDFCSTLNQQIFERFQDGNFPKKYLPVTSFKSH